MRKKLLMKSLLVAAALCVGGNAWAGTHYIVNEDFNSQPSVWSKAVDGVTYKLYSGSETDYYVYQAGRSSGHNAIWYSPTRDWNDDIDEYTVEFDFNTSVNGSYLQGEIALLDANSTVSGRMDTNGFLTTATNATNNLFFAQSTAVADGVTTYTINGKEKTFTMAANTWYHFALTINKSSKEVSYTITASGKDQQTGSYTASSTTGIATGVFIRTPRSGNINFDNLVITNEVAGDVAAVPTIDLTGLNGTERTYTITYLPGETLHYVLPGGSEQTVSTGTSAVVSTSTSGTLRAWTTMGTATSAEATIAVVAENVTLAAPWIYISGMAANGTKYNAVLNGGNSQESVLLKPTATQTATFTPVGGVAANVSLPYTAEEKGVLTITVSAEGYTSASTSFNIEGSYVQTWQSADFSSLVGADAVQTALGGTWTLSDDHGRWASWDKTKSYNFYATSTSGNHRDFNDNIYFRDVVVLAEGMGLGRNVTGGEAIAVSNTKANQIVGFEIYNGYGKDIVKGTNTYMSYSLCDGVNRPSMSSNNGALLVQATIYSPALVSPTIGSTGYATFASDYALDFSAATGVKAYYATAAADGKVTMAQVTGTAAAGGGLFLQKTTGDIAIPVVASGDALTGNLLVRGTGAEVAKEDGFNKYVLGAEDESVAFFLINATAATVATDKAYLKVAADATPARLAIAFEDSETTGIATVENANVLNENYYNLNGQRIVAPQKGLYIVNGKKVVMK